MEASTCSASGSPTGLRPRTCTSNIRSNQSTARRKPAVSVRTADMHTPALKSRRPFQDDAVSCPVSMGLSPPRGGVAGTDRATPPVASTPGGGENLGGGGGHFDNLYALYRDHLCLPLLHAWRSGRWPLSCMRIG